MKTGSKNAVLHTPTALSVDRHTNHTTLHCVLVTFTLTDVPDNKALRDKARLEWCLMMLTDAAEMVEWHHSKAILVGPGRAGKDSLKRALTKKPFNGKQPSTRFPDQDDVTTNTPEFGAEETHNWNTQERCVTSQWVWRWRLHTHTHTHTHTHICRRLPLRLTEVILWLSLMIRAKARAPFTSMPHSNTTHTHIHTHTCE